MSTLMKYKSFKCPVFTYRFVQAHSFKTYVKKKKHSLYNYHFENIKFENNQQSNAEEK